MALYFIGRAAAGAFLAAVALVAAAVAISAILFVAVCALIVRGLVWSYETCRSIETP